MQKNLFWWNYKDIVAVLLLCLCSFIFIAPLFLQSQMFSMQDLGQGDVTHLYYPQKHIYAQELKAGRFPLWTSSIFTGYPLVADGQFGPFFLPNIVLYFLFPTYLAFNLSYVLTFIISSLGMYFYSRHLGLSRFSSVFTSIIFTFSFVFVARIFHLNVVQSFAFLPWLLLIAEKFLIKGSRINFLLFAFLLSQQYLAGFIQGTVYVVAGVFLIIFFRYYKKQNFIKNIILLGIACLLALAMSAIQIMPTSELSKLSTRNGFSLMGYNYPYPPIDLAYLIYPFFWGDPSIATYTRDTQYGLFWENNMYAGILPFIFLIIGFFHYKNHKLKPFIYTFFTSLLFSLGVIFFLLYIPPFSFFRIPQRFLFITVFAYAIIAGFALDFMLEKFKKKISPSYIIYFLCIIIIFATFADLALYSHKYNSTISKDEWFKEPQTVTYLKENKIKGRVFSIGSYDDWLYIYKNVSHGWRSENADKLLANRAILHPNTNAIYNISAFYGYGGFKTQNVNLVNSLIFPKSKLTGETFEIASSSARLLGMESIEYIISSKDIVSNSDDLQLVWKKFNDKTKTTYRIYKNKQFVERIHSVHEVHGKQSVNQMANDLLSPNFKPKDTAFIFDSNGPYDFKDKVKITNIKFDEQEILFHTSSTGKSFIVIADSFYPGWKAIIDESETKLLNTNINSRGIIVPPGDHKIRVYYEPSSFKAGIAISFASLLLGLIILAYPFFKKIGRWFASINTDNS